MLSESQPTRSLKFAAYLSRHLQPKQRQFVTALRDNDQPLYRIINKQKIKPAQLNLWLQNKRFRRAIDKALAIARRRVIVELQLSSHQAIRRLGRIATATKPPRVASPLITAIRVVIDLANEMALQARPQQNIADTYRPNLGPLSPERARVLLKQMDEDVAAFVARKTMEEDYGELRTDQAAGVSAAPAAAGAGAARRL